MKRDYTMDDFHAEMRRRGVNARTRVVTYDSKIVAVLPCRVHPLHLVKVHANGSLSSCMLCERQIEDCRKEHP